MDKSSYARRNGRSKQEKKKVQISTEVGCEGGKDYGQEHVGGFYESLQRSLLPVNLAHQLALMSLDVLSYK